MKTASPSGFLRSIYRKVRWRLTFTYLLVSLTALFVLGWWVLIASTLYLRQIHPTQGWMDILRLQVIPALRVIVPSVIVLVLPAALVSSYFGFLNARWIDIRLSNLRKAAHSWQRGDFSVKVHDPSDDEISAFGQELNGMAHRLEGLLRTREDLAALEERIRLSRDLHDSVKQQITAAAFQIGSARALVEKDPQTAQNCLAEAESLVHNAHQELNAIILELRPVENGQGTLSQALRECGNDWARQNPIRLRLDLQDGIRVEPAMQQEIVRFTREALSNVARHSQASEASIDLHVKDGSLELSVRDDGCGFDPALVSGRGFGLKTMRERILELGGQYALTSQVGKGTWLVASLPLWEGERQPAHA
jgi:signal transduction histidine kinase